MAYDKFLIAPLVHGQQNDVKPWLLMDTAFARLRNSYVWRGSLRKRIGSQVMNGSKSAGEQQLFSRLRVNIGTTGDNLDGTGDLGATVVPGTKFNVGQMFSCGSEIYTVNVLGTPAQLLSTSNTAANLAEYHTSGGSAGTFTLTNGPANTDVYFYPADPVMELATYEVASINDETLIAFDTQFAYSFVYATGWNRLIGGAAANVWTGTDSNFFWTTNYRGAASQDYLLFVTNNVAADAMRYWDGANWNAWGSAGTTPIDGAGNFIKTCKVIMPFKDRLLLMNVTENIGAADITFRNRVRISQNGSPISATAWREDQVGKGSYLEAPTKEAIISAEFVKDRLIIYFENSTWELAYTGNEVLPFRFQQLDSDLGVESQNSVISFDKTSVGIGRDGIFACNGVNLDRIDNLIPDTIFEISNSNNGPERTHGIRDYYSELLYWNYPSIEEQDAANVTYPNRMLVYDYNSNTWAYNDDSFTAMGNYYLQQTLVWQDISAAWEDLDTIWNDPSVQNRFRSVIAGNQDGWTFILGRDFNNNAQSLQITNITLALPTITFKVYGHNLRSGSYVQLQNIVDDGTIGTLLNNTIHKVTTTDADTFTINTDLAPAGNYQGAGTVRRISEIDILTKRYNFYNQVGQNIAINQVDFLVDSTSNGQVLVDFLPSSTDRSFVSDAIASGSILGTNVLETSPYPTITLEQTQERFWHSVYPQANGETIQIRIYMNDEQLKTPSIVNSAFQLNAMMIYGVRTSQFGG